MITQVQAFHIKFRLPTGKDDVLSDDKRAQEFRVKFLQEELDELKEALDAGDRVKAFDALLDLAYVTYGTALFMGVDPLQWHHGMNAVQKANMAKERAVKAEDSKRGSTFDVVKPKGWTGPEERLKEILSW
jgi:hypothetical protein